MLQLPSLALLLLPIPVAVAAVRPASAPTSPRVLVYTATGGYRHDSIPTAIQQLGRNAQPWGVQFVFTEDQQHFNDTGLADFDAVMFVHNSGEVLDTNGQAALKQFFQRGGVYTGVHGASTCLVNDTNYQQAVGAIFDYHPSIQLATFERTDKTHPSTAHLPDQWRFEEEVYYFRSDPRSNGATVVLTVDPGSYNNNGQSQGDFPPQGEPHPIAWYIEAPRSAQPLADSVPKAGRSFYTSLGHLNSTWQDELFIEHVMNGLSWALDGASTRAYGSGLVGSTSTTPNPAAGGAAGSASPPGASGAVAGPATSGAASSSATSSGAAPSALSTSASGAAPSPGPPPQPSSAGPRSHLAVGAVVSAAALVAALVIAG